MNTPTIVSPVALNLVVRKRKKSVTTSLLVAEKFGKQHKNVIQRIENIISEDVGDRLNFQPIFYHDSYDREQKMYEMDKHSFIILAMRFTGKKALEWQHRFVDAFEAMELAILEQKNKAWEETRIEGKQVRYELTEEIQDFIEYAEAQGSQNAKMYYMQITKMANQALFLIGRKAPQHFRNMLDMMQLSFLQTAEFVARNALRNGMQDGMYYKDIYVMARDKVTAFAATVGQTPIIGLPESIAVKAIEGGVAL
jgi:Rha family phage regulatory protein